VRACVVDASVGIKLVIEEDLTDKAEALFLFLAADPPARFYVPDLFYIECGNILWKQVRRFGYPLDQAREALAELHALALRSTPTKELLLNSLEVAAEHGVTAYDASYVALAEGLAVPLVTADEKLVRTLAETPHQVHWLGDFPTPPVSAG
jgi:predicted nucleic acid-binding protein